MLTQKQLREIYPPPSNRAQLKRLDSLEEQSQLFIEASPLVFLATYGDTGACDCSPRGGDPGFVKILNNTRLIIPDFRGNNRLDSIENIIQTGKIGCVFLIPGISETLRINGTAHIDADPDIIRIFHDKIKAYIQIEIEDVYIHCGKSLIRSRVWDESTFTNPSDFPSMGQILNKQLGQAVLPESHSEITELYRQSMAYQTDGEQSIAPNT